MKRGDRVRAGGLEGRVVDFRRLPDAWSYGRPDPPRWMVWVEFDDGSRREFFARDLERLERTKS